MDMILCVVTTDPIRRIYLDQYIYYNYDSGLHVHTMFQEARELGL